MNIEGTYTLQAPPGEVWKCLLDPQILQRTVPGVERIERDGEDIYIMTVNVKQQPLKGMYQGKVTISEQQFPYHYRLTIQGDGRQSQLVFNGAGGISLNEQNGATVIAYKGELTLQKTSTLSHPSLVKGAAKLLIQQFFTALADQLRTRMVVGVAGESLGERKVAGTIVAVPPAVSSNAASAFSVQGILQKGVHRVHLGGGDPGREARWGEGLRRLTIIAGLLLLVWLGTRLPRQKRKENWAVKDQ